MLIAVNRMDNASAAKWGDRWLKELDAIKPTSDDERSALDIARVENVQVYGDANRIIPALIESEHAMPNNYVASLRLAQAELMANQFADAIGTINRGLARKPGAVGRSWLLEMKAEVLTHGGKPDEARKALQSALMAAEQIPTPESRKRTIDRIRQALDAMTKTPPIQKQR
jgi:predicted Zn-dependent protease